jgi:ribosomal protein L23
MKRMICMSALLIVLMSGYVLAETEKTINAKNEFGGKTKEYVFSVNDQTYRQGIARAIVYYDGNGKKVKTERYHTDDFAMKKGVAKAIISFDSNEKPVKTEFYDRNGKPVPVK